MAPDRRRRPGGGGSDRGLWVDYRETLDRPLGIKETAYFEIAKGEGLSHIADRLKAQGIVTKPLWFKVLAYREGVHTRLRYGEYAIPPNTTLRGLLAMFVAGKVRQHPVALVEGWTFQDLLAALGRHPALVGTTVGKSPEEIMALLGAPGQSPEGRFFPDTYFVTKGTTDLELLRRAHERMRAVLEREWQERAPSVPFASADQALILASIVEKETARPEERPAVAGVLVRRLAKGMRLQTDPTVIYGLGADFGNLRKSDLKRDTPTTPTPGPVYRPPPSPCPGLPRSAPPCTRRRAPVCTSWPAVTAAMCSPPPSTSIGERWISSKSINMGRARFITLEGEGVGKTTNLEFVERHLALRGVRFVRTRNLAGPAWGRRSGTGCSVSRPLRRRRSSCCCSPPGPNTWTRSSDRPCALASG